jgi:hypothetical protein
MRGLVRGFGLKLGRINHWRLPERAREWVGDNEILMTRVTSMLRGHAAPCCVWLVMTSPGFGAVLELHVKAGIDDTVQFRS